MKYRTAIKKICPACRIVTRERRVFVMCENKRHKQKQYFRPIKARSFATWASATAHQLCAEHVVREGRHFFGIPNNVSAPSSRRRVCSTSHQVCACCA